MCKKLIYVASFVLVLGLILSAGGGSMRAPGPPPSTQVATATTAPSRVIHSG